MHEPHRSTRSLRHPLLPFLAIPMVACVGGGAPSENASVGNAAQPLHGCLGDVGACLHDAESRDQRADCHAAFSECALETAPAELQGKLEGLSGCADAGLACAGDAEKVSDLLACGEAKAHCIGEVLNMTVLVLPGADALMCLEGAAECAKQAAAAADLDVCIADISDCSQGVLDDFEVPELDGVPPEVTDAANAIVDCNAELAGCVGDAQTGSELAACAELKVACVGDVLNLDVPMVPGSEALACIEAAGECALAAESLGDLATCHEELTSCALSLVPAAPEPPMNAPAPMNMPTPTNTPTPDPLEDAFAGALTCGDDQLRCLSESSTISEGLACSEAYNTCIAETLGVPAPGGQPFAGAAACFESAASCILEAGSGAELGACGDQLLACTEALASDRAAPGVRHGGLDCALQGTQCLLENPFDLAGCTEQAQRCQMGSQP